MARKMLYFHVHPVLLLANVDITPSSSTSNITRSRLRQRPCPRPRLRPHPGSFPSLSLSLFEATACCCSLVCLFIIGLFCFLILSSHIIFISNRFLTAAGNSRFKTLMIMHSAAVVVDVLHSS